MVQAKMPGLMAPGVAITIPQSLTTQTPLYGFGQLIPLHDRLQPTPGVTYFGAIVGLELTRWEDGEHMWSYTVELPSEHPRGGIEDWQAIYTENEITMLMESL